jgi:hypothetical protein
LHQSALFINITAVLGISSRLPILGPPPPPTLSPPFLPTGFVLPPSPPVSKPNLFDSNQQPGLLSLAGPTSGCGAAHLLLYLAVVKIVARCACCFSHDFDSCDRQLAAALAAVYVASAMILIAVTGS